ncbi:armadillo repeat-containing protein 7 [Pectinophora gossypiella]|uniref:armadillo repeat-containing protein 7 n=1 Tax=Pectinophora gossypiella TaxID=13191 RepID=UPI00214E5771|nr:armadillo repeat-containing protein 7 [Pectinophora gossypiella]
MFSNKSQLRKRTPENGTDRESFLSLLVDEYLNTTSFDAKCQVLANLANFAYDPINYGYIRNVGVLDIFLYVLKKETNLKLLHFACAGICNLCIDPLNSEYILTHAGLKPLLGLLKCEQTDTVCDTITALLYLYNQKTKSQITTPEVVQIMQEFTKSNDKRLVNLATVFLQDVCNSD